MGKPKNFVFSYQEVAQALVDKTDMREGHWGVYVEFGLGASNVGTPDNLTPAAIIPILKLGIQRFDSPNSLTVDAGAKKPKKKAPRKKRVTTRSRARKTKA